MKNKEGSFRMIVIFMIATMLIAFNWDKWTWLSGPIHKVLDPSVGALLNWQLEIGMLIVLLLLAIVTSLIQKYTTNQDELRRIKKEQKEIQKQMKEFKAHPEKVMRLQKKQMALMPKQMKLTMRSIVYTGIPFILFYRWFNDFFVAMGSPKFFGFMGWFIFYLLGLLIFSAIIRKKFDIV